MRRGFTLVELVLVAAIIAVLSAVALPRYSSSLANFRVKTAARRIAVDIATAQAHARAASASKRIDFSPGEPTYTVVGIAGLSGAATYTVNLADEPYRCGLKVTYSAAGSGNRITFNGYGWPDRGATFEVTSGSAKRTVTLDATTGATSIN
jgi:prepilin-type N-terminal cleavage/methylation domain-containing protein